MYTVGVSARKWTSSNSKFSIEATLVEVQGVNVNLRKSDGTVISAPVARLSESDRNYRAFDYSRYVAVVLWLCRQLSVVTVTSVNKLLFYVDFLHFKSEAVSLTGAAYVRFQHGPVPAAYGDLQQSMELHGFIEVQEVQYQNGRTGMEFRPGPKADELKAEFTSRELKVLEAVGWAFRNDTPGAIRDRSHQESAWKDTEDRSFISYQKASDLSLPVPT